MEPNRPGLKFWLDLSLLDWVTLDNSFNLSAPPFLLLHMALVMFTWRGLWEKRGWMNITYVKYLATWLAPCRCSEMLGFPPAPFLFLSLWLLHLLFCLTLTNYEPALHRQVNHPETKCSPWLSFHMMGFSKRVLPALRLVLELWGFPVNSDSSRLSLGLLWVSWFQSTFLWQLLGQDLRWGLGKWGPLRK